jgi:hypothetical protein
VQANSPSQSRGADDDRHIDADRTPCRPNAVSLVTTHDARDRGPVVGDDSDHLE